MVVIPCLIKNIRGKCNHWILAKANNIASHILPIETFCACFSLLPSLFSFSSRPILGLALKEDGLKGGSLFFIYLYIDCDLSLYGHKLALRESHLWSFQSLSSVHCWLGPFEIGYTLFLCNTILNTLKSCDRIWLYMSCKCRAPAFPDCNNSCNAPCS